MKKRKITRASLDELAKIMPTLTEKECRSVIGGAWYYYPNGDFKEETGSSDNIYVYENGKNVLLSEATNTAKRNVIGTLTKEIMGYSGQIGLADSGTIHANLDKNGTLWLNSGAKTLNNYYDLRSILEHEGAHYDDFKNSGSVITGRDAEIKAYERQVSSPDYSKTSQNHKIEVVMNWYKQTGYDSTQKQSIANACGVKTSDF